MPSIQRIIFLLMLPVLLVGGLSQCSAPGSSADVVVSVKDQKLAIYDQSGAKGRSYPVSTSRFGINDKPGTYGTPAGMHEVVAKIGQGVRAGTVFKNRHATGEVIKPGTPGRDPIVSRIMWLRGLESQNKNAYGRCIYIHGTADEADIGRPVSWGCIRMKSSDVIDLFGSLPIGTRVLITESSLPSSVTPGPGPTPATPPSKREPLLLNPQNSSQHEVMIAENKKGRKPEPEPEITTKPPTKKTGAVAAVSGTPPKKTGTVAAVSVTPAAASRAQDPTDGSFQRRQLPDGSTIIYSAPGGSPPIKLRSKKTKPDES